MSRLKLRDEQEAGAASQGSDGKADQPAHSVINVPNVVVAHRPSLHSILHQRHVTGLEPNDDSASPKKSSKRVARCEAEV
jgi:hypothetical protein